MAQHRIYACDHILCVTAERLFVREVSIVSLFLTALHSAGTSRYILGVLLASQSLQRLIQILQLLVLLLPEL